MQPQPIAPTKIVQYRGLDRPIKYRYTRFKGGDMNNPVDLEEAYKDFSENLKKWAPDGVINVDLAVLGDLGLLTYDRLEGDNSQDVTHFFHVIETQDKITLHNEQFAVWISPKLIDGMATTLTYIALLNKNKPHLEIVYSTSGVYNTPKFILKVLQHFLIEVVDTETIISSIGKKE